MATSAPPNINKPQVFQNNGKEHPDERTRNQIKALVQRYDVSLQAVRAEWHKLKSLYPGSDNPLMRKSF